MLGPVKGMVDEMYEISGTGGRDYNPYAYSQFCGYMLYLILTQDTQDFYLRRVPH